MDFQLVISEPKEGKNTSPAAQTHKCFNTVPVSPHKSTSAITFPKFGFLPPELQLKVWEFAVANCYLLAADTEEVLYVGFNGRSFIKMETVLVHRLIETRWKPLMLACKTSNAVANRVGEKERPEMEKRRGRERDDTS